MTVVIESRLYTTREVSERLRVSQWWVWQLLRTGQLQGVRPRGTGNYRITEQALQEYLSGEPRTESAA